MRKHNGQFINEATTFSKLLGQPGGARDELPSCSNKMGIQDGYISCHVRIYTKHKLIYEFNRGGIYENFFSRKSYHQAGRRFDRYLGILRELMGEQFLAALEKTFGWVLKRGRPRQTDLIFFLPDSPLTNETKPRPDDYSI